MTMNLQLKCFFFSLSSCSAITEVPTASDAVASIASSDKYCGRLMSKEFGNSPFQKCLEKIGIASDEQFTMCVTDLSLYYGKGTKHLEKAICNNLDSFALQCAENGIPVDWRSDELCRKYIIIIYPAHYLLEQSS